MRGAIVVSRFRWRVGVDRCGGDDAGGCRELTSCVGALELQPAGWRLKIGSLPLAATSWTLTLYHKHYLSRYKKFLGVEVMKP